MKGEASESIDLRGSWEGLTGRGVRVGVVDSGIHAAHPHVGGRVSRSIAVLPAARGGGDGRPRLAPDEAGDLSGHGTAVAGVIVEGAPEAELFSVRLLDRWQRAHHGRLVAAIRWCRAEGLDVVNLSLGSSREEAAGPLREACAEAAGEGVILVAAAGPGGQGGYPAGFRELVLGVAGDPTCRDWEVRFDAGETVPFRAAGRPRALPGGAGEGNFRGSSFAAARVTALVARLRQWRPGMTAEEARAALVGLCRLAGGGELIPGPGRGGGAGRGGPRPDSPLVPGGTAPGKSEGPAEVRRGKPLRPAAGWASPGEA